jgi:hypothetical protein
MSREDKYTFKATQSRDKKSITVTGCLDSNSSPPIMLEIKTTPDEWDSLQQYLFDARLPENNYGDRIIADLFKFTSCALETVEEKKPRGQHKKTKPLVDVIKEQASYLYPFLKYWCKKPLEQWPDPLKNIVVMASKDGYGYLLRKTDKNNSFVPEILTAYCINKVHAEEAKKLGLLPFFEDDKRGSVHNIYFTYIKGDGTSQDIYKTYIKGKTYTEVEHYFNAFLSGQTKIDGIIYYSFPLRDLFKSLGII